MCNNKYLICLLFFSSLLACRPSDDIVIVTVKESAEVFAALEYKEEGQTTFSDFRIETGYFDEDYQHVMWHGNVSAGLLGPTLILGAYPSNFGNSRPLFGLQFWAEGLSDDEPWTSEELDHFFAPGTSFDFGQGSGRVEVMVQLPPRAEYDIEASRPSFLVDPQGVLTITGIEDYDYPTFGGNNPGQSYGKLIRCTFSGELGRYDGFADQADGMPGFRTDEVVEIKNGEALFYVEYTWE